MTSKFDGFQQDLPAEVPAEQNDSTPDRFELISAYIDGELSPSEKKQVQAWLDRDPEFKQLYTQLLTLQSQIQHSVAPPSNKSIDEITAGVFESIDRSHRWKRQLVWGGSAIAASVIACVSVIIPGNNTFSPQIAEIKSDTISSPVMLAVALDKPAIDIPKVAVDYVPEAVDIEVEEY